MEPRRTGPRSDGSSEERRPQQTDSSTPITRRRYLVIGATIAAVSGCVGDDDDGADAADDDTEDHTDDDFSDDETAPGDGDDAGDPADDSPGDTDGEQEGTLAVSEDYESYILEMEITYEGPEGEWTQHVYREADIANDQLYQNFEMTGDDGDPEGFEHYIANGEAYQILPDGSCGPTGEEAILVYGETLGDFERPRPDDVDTDDEHITYEGTTTVDWIDEPVSVWVFDLESSPQAIDGVLEMYIGEESGYLVGYEGWYTTGAHDDPAEFTIDYRRHSFNQPVEIEVPDECTAE